MNTKLLLLFASILIIGIIISLYGWYIGNDIICGVGIVSAVQGICGFITRDE